MPILYESLFFSPNGKVDSEETIVIGVTGYTCPVCGETGFPTLEDLYAHMKAFHPFHWHFWYAPHGKPLLALCVGGTLIGIGYAFAPKGKK